MDTAVGVAEEVGTAAGVAQGPEAEGLDEQEAEMLAWSECHWPKWQERCPWGRHHRLDPASAGPPETAEHVSRP